MTMTQTNYTNNSNNRYALFGGLFLCYMLFFRLLYTRLPRDLYVNISFYLLAIYTIILLLLFVLLYKCMYTVIHKKELRLKNVLFEKVAKLIYLPTKGLLALDTLIKSFLGSRYDDFMSKICLFVFDFISYRIGLWLVILLDFCPRIILTIIFAVDVIYYQHYNFFLNLFLLESCL